MRTAIAALLCLCLLTGCNRHDAGDLAPVTACGISRAENGYTLFAELAQPSADNAAPDAMIVSGTATDLLSAIDAVGSGRDAQLYWSHARVILLDESVWSEDISDLTDMLMESTDIRSSVIVCAVRQVTAQTVLKQTDSISGDPSGFALGDSLRQAVRTSQMPDMPLYRVFHALRSEGMDAVLPAITVRDGGAVPDGCILFQDGHRVGSLSARQTALLALLRAEGERAVYDNGQERIPLQHPTSSVSVQSVNDTPTLQLRLTVSASCASNGQAHRTAQALEQDCLHLIRILQRTGCDALGFGRALEQEHQKADWRSLNSAVHVTVKPLPDTKGGS